MDGISVTALEDLIWLIKMLQKTSLPLAAFSLAYLGLLYMASLDKDAMHHKVVAKMIELSKGIVIIVSTISIIVWISGFALK